MLYTAHHCSGCAGVLNCLLNTCLKVVVGSEESIAHDCYVYMVVFVGCEEVHCRVSLGEWVGGVVMGKKGVSEQQWVIGGRGSEAVS